jgi:hypothetical protein
MKSHAPIIGCWELRESDPPVYFGEKVQMQFDPNGRFTYGALERGTWQVMLMVYRAEGATLVTNQPSSPREESTVFEFRPDGMLQLEFGGSVCVFERVSDLSFEIQKH